MNRAGICPALGLLVLELVQFREDLDGDPDVIILEALEGEGVVEEHIGIQHEVLYSCGRRRRLPARVAVYHGPGPGPSGAGVPGRAGA